MKIVSGIFGLGLVSSVIGVSAQVTGAPKTAFDSPVMPVQVIYLTNATQPADGNEIQTALRNLLPASAKIYFVPSQNALFIEGPPEQIALAQTVVHDLDHPKKSFRLTYTISEIEAGKKVGTHHFSMIVADGQRIVLKQGSKIPIATGSTGSSPSTAQTQFQYLDVGMNFDATLSSVAGGGVLKTKVERSSVAEVPSTISGVAEPVIRQATIEGTSVLTMGKPLTLGSLDGPTGTAHLDVEVMMELVP